MEPQSKLLLVPGTGDSSGLAKRILHLLRERYAMGDSVALLKSLRGHQVQKGLKKAHVYPLVLDSFDDDETRVDVGRNVLYDQIRGKHIAVIKYLYTPKRRPNMSINDHLKEVRAFLKVIKNTETLHRTLVAPYNPYLRSHSIESYKGKGFFQFDSLDEMIDDLHRGELNSLISIDPHSDKVVEVAAKYGIDAHMVDPFRSNEYINPAKLGLDLVAADEAEQREIDEYFNRLQPFVEHYKNVKDKYGKICLISPDNGAEKRVEEFLVHCRRVDPELSWNMMGYRGKDRDTIEKSAGMFKSFSKVNESNIDPETTYVIVDDMLSSGGTAEDIAEILKKEGAKRVELWCSHAVAPNRKKVESLKYIDKIVVLDTVLHDKPEDMHIEYVEASPELLAAELYKVHMRLEEQRFSV